MIYISFGHSTHQTLPIAITTLKFLEIFFRKNELLNDLTVILICFDKYTKLLYFFYYTFHIGTISITYPIKN